MKKLIILICILLLSVVSANAKMLVRRGVFWSCSYTFCESWEGSESISGCSGVGTADNSGWTCYESTNGVVDADYTTNVTDCDWGQTTIQSLRSYNPSTESNNYISYDIGSEDATWGVYYKVYIDSTTKPATYQSQYFFTVYSTSISNYVFYLGLDIESGDSSWHGEYRYRKDDNSYSALIDHSLGSLSLDTWYVIEIKYDGTNNNLYIRINGTEDIEIDADNQGADIFNFGAQIYTQPIEERIGCIQISNDMEYPSGN